VSFSTHKRTLRRAHAGTYRDHIATAWLRHALTDGDVNLVLYDVTTLYCEAEKEDDGAGGLRKVGYSKERRVAPQIVVGLLVDIVVLADAGMLSASNLHELDEANLRFIVGSRVTKAPVDLESHFRWHGDAFTTGRSSAPIPHVRAATRTRPVTRRPRPKRSGTPSSSRVLAGGVALLGQTHGA
jgi:transposase